MEHPHINNRVN